MSYKPKVLAIAEGGSGVSSNTAYSVLFGGTTSTGPLQSISVGSSGNVLLSNGAGSLPSFQTVASTFIMNFNGVDNAGAPLDATTYYAGTRNTFETTQSRPQSWLYIPINCTLNAVYGRVVIAGTLGSNENVSIYARVNNTTDTALTTTSQWTTNPTLITATSIGLSLSAGDYIQIKIVTPTWATNPTTVTTTFSLAFS